MNILVVSTYPPMACGIGKYAEQQVRALRGEGHRVDVLSPPDGDGDFTADLYGGLKILQILKLAWAYDDMIIHFTPFFYYEQEGRRSRLLTSLGFLMLTLLAGRRISFLIHETGYKLDATREKGWRHWIDRWYWRLARRVIFHSQRERDVFCEFYGFSPARKAFEIWSQDRYLIPLCTLDRRQARAALGLKPGGLLLLCIGFIQPHKGYERAIAALRQVEAPHLKLKIVGSVRLDWDQAHEYAQTLHHMADADPRCEVIEGYLSDETFDTWFVAADAVIVPYHEIWTSAVAARARLYERPLIAANTGGLAEQLTPGSRLFSSDGELAEILREFASAGAGADPAATSPPA